MTDSPMTDSHKRALVIAYYLSRFDRKGVQALGYSGFTEAFEKVGAAIGVKAATVKHMRDSFDPYCSQVRVGWYQRKILPSRANVIQAYAEVSAEAMAVIVQELMRGSDAAVQLYIAPIATVEEGAEALLSEDNAFANRLRTGEKAEAFFMAQYPELPLFQGSRLEDTRKLGIGFDFRAAFPGRYRAIEVKGILERQGVISFTDKEWSVARLLGDEYILALVRSLDHAPTLDLFPDPAHHLTATMRTVETVSVCWNAKV